MSCVFFILGMNTFYASLSMSSINNVYIILYEQQIICFLSFISSLNKRDQMSLVKTQANQASQPKHPLESIIEKPAKVITNDGRVFVGVLRGMDHAMNCVLNDCEQRIYSEEEGVRKFPLGVYFIRGDSIVLLGKFSEDQEDQIALKDTKCLPLKKCQ